jgi:hypothetical protein
MAKLLSYENPQGARISFYWSGAQPPTDEQLDHIFATKHSQDLENSQRSGANAEKAELTRNTSSFIGQVKEHAAKDLGDIFGPLAGQTLQNIESLGHDIAHPIQTYREKQAENQIAQEAAKHPASVFEDSHPSYDEVRINSAAPINPYEGSDSDIPFISPLATIGKGAAALVAPEHIHGITPEKISRAGSTLALQTAMFGAPMAHGEVPSRIPDILPPEESTAIIPSSRMQNVEPIDIQPEQAGLPESTQRALPPSTQQIEEGVEFPDQQMRLLGRIAKSSQPAQQILSPTGEPIGYTGETGPPITSVPARNEPIQVSGTTIREPRLEDITSSPEPRPQQTIQDIASPDSLIDAGMELQDIGKLPETPEPPKIDLSKKIEASPTVKPTTPAETLQENQLPQVKAPQNAYQKMSDEELTQLHNLEPNEETTTEIQNRGLIEPSKTPEILSHEPTPQELELRNIQQRIGEEPATQEEFDRAGEQFRKDYQNQEEPNPKQDLTTQLKETKVEPSETHNYPVSNEALNNFPNEDKTFSIIDKLKLSPDLKEEVEHHLNNYFEDPGFIEDNQGSTPESLVKAALDDIVNMGEDYGGAFSGIHEGWPETEKSSFKSWKKMRGEASRKLTKLETSAQEPTIQEGEYDPVQQLKDLGYIPQDISRMSPEQQDFIIKKGTTKLAPGTAEGSESEPQFQSKQRMAREKAEKESNRLMNLLGEESGEFRPGEFVRNLFKLRENIDPARQYVNDMVGKIMRGEKLSSLEQENLKSSGLHDMVFKYSNFTGEVDRAVAKILGPTIGLKSGTKMFGSADWNLESNPWTKPIAEVIKGTGKEPVGEIPKNIWLTKMFQEVDKARGKILTPSEDKQVSAILDTFHDIPTTLHDENTGKLVSHKVLNLADDYRTILNSVLEYAQEMGATSRSGKPLTGIWEYFPHLMKDPAIPENLKASFASIIKPLTRGGLRKNIDDYLNSYMGKAAYYDSHGVHINPTNDIPLEGAEVSGGGVYSKVTPSAGSSHAEQRWDIIRPEDLEQSSDKLMRAYLESMSRLIFDKPAIQSANEMLQKLPDGPMKRNATWYVRNYARADALDLSGELRKAQQTVANIGARSVLFGNSRLQLLHLTRAVMSVWPEFGTVPTIGAITDIAAHPIEAVKETHAAGLLRNWTVPKMMKGKMELLDDLGNFFDAGNTVAKTIAYKAAQYKYPDNPKAAIDAAARAEMITSPARGIEAIDHLGPMLAQFKSWLVKYGELQARAYIKAAMEPSMESWAKAFRYMTAMAGLYETGKILGLHLFHMSYYSFQLGSTVLQTTNRIAEKLSSGKPDDAAIELVKFMLPGGHSLPRESKGSTIFQDEDKTTLSRTHRRPSIPGRHH